MDEQVQVNSKVMHFQMKGMWRRRILALFHGRVEGEKTAQVEEGLGLTDWTGDRRRETSPKIISSLLPLNVHVLHSQFKHHRNQL